MNGKPRGSQVKKAKRICCQQTYLEREAKEEPTWFTRTWEHCSRVLLGGRWPSWCHHCSLLLSSPASQTLPSRLRAHPAQGGKTERKWSKDSWNIRKEENPQKGEIHELGTMDFPSPLNFSTLCLIIEGKIM